MKAKDLRERSNEDLKELEKSLAKDTFTARFKNFTNRLDDTSTINKTKRDLARVKTLLRQAELNAASTAAPAAKIEAKPAAPKAPKAKKTATTAKTAKTAKTAAKKASKSEAK
jgi:large subunit ribosomal protein L29